MLGTIAFEMLFIGMGLFIYTRSLSFLRSVYPKSRFLRCLPPKPRVDPWPPDWHHVKRPGSDLQNWPPEMRTWTSYIVVFHMLIGIFLIVQAVIMIVLGFFGVRPD